MPQPTPPPASSGGRLRRCLDFGLRKLRDVLDARLGSTLADVAAERRGRSRRPGERQRKGSLGAPRPPRAAGGGEPSLGSASNGHADERPSNLIQLVWGVLGDSAIFLRFLILVLVLGAIVLVMLMLLIGHVTLDPTTLGHAFQTIWSQVNSGTNNARVKTIVTSGCGVMVLMWVKRRIAAHRQRPKGGASADGQTI
jgi:hypothetical protein